MSASNPPAMMTNRRMSASDVGEFLLPSQLNRAGRGQCHAPASARRRADDRGFIAVGSPLEQSLLNESARGDLRGARFCLAVCSVLR